MLVKQLPLIQLLSFLFCAFAFSLLVYIVFHWLVPLVRSLARLPVYMVANLIDGHIDRLGTYDMPAYDRSARRVASLGAERPEQNRIEWNRTEWNR